MNINLMIFRTINGLAYHNEILDKFMIFMSEYVPYIFMIVLSAMYIMGLVKKNIKMRNVTVDTFLIILINLFIGYVIGTIWYVPRPFVNNKVNLLMPHTADASFPSDHAIGTMSIAVGIGRYSKIYGGLLGMLSIIIGISRVFVGHHYPADVLGGYAIVFMTSYLYDHLLRKKVKSVYFDVEKLLSERFPVLKQFL